AGVGDMRLTEAGVTTVTNGRSTGDGRGNGELFRPGEVHGQLRRFSARRHNNKVIALAETAGFKAYFKAIHFDAVGKITAYRAGGHNSTVADAFNAEGVIIGAGKFQLVITGG